MAESLKIDPARIKSFIRRQGRATAGQVFALENFRQQYCLNVEDAFDQEKVFGRKADLIVEIGFGNGDSLAQMALAHPERDYIGIEVHRPGVGHLMMRLQEMGLSNVRIFHHDAIEVMEKTIPDYCISGVHLFFPDPWHKRRHHKRRIVRPVFLDLLVRKLKINGYFHAATDWKNYASEMLSLFRSDNRFSNQSTAGDFCIRPDYRPLTKFEARGLGLGHGVWDLIFVRSEA